MIELPEALTLARQLSEAVVGKTVRGVLPPTKPHKFCWWSGEPADYAPQLCGARIVGAKGFGIFVEIEFDNGLSLCVNDGVNVRLIEVANAPKDYQLLIEFADATALVLTVAMYGGIVLHREDYDNTYWQKSRAAMSPFDKAFKAHFVSLLKSCKPTMSAKAFLATEQRFPGIGNGVVQDVLFAAGIHPKRELGTLEVGDGDRLRKCVVSVLRAMVDGGGRDTEKDLFGNAGQYRTQMSKHTVGCGCPTCGTLIRKEAYMGGSVYYCTTCQPLGN